MASLAYALEVSFQEFGAANLKAFLDDLGCKLIHAVFGSIAEHMVDGTATILGSSVLTNMLDAPVAKLTMSHDVDVVKHLVDTGALFPLV